MTIIDEYSQRIQKETGAAFVLICCIGSPEVTGFSVTGTEESREYLPVILERIAADIRNGEEGIDVPST